MSKNIIIQKNGVDQTLNGVKKLRTKNVSGGTSDWIPEDETQTGTIIIKKNGTFNAADDALFGYSKAVVKVPGMVVGMKDGKEYTVSVDENGFLEEEKIPVQITITFLPTKTSYDDGDTIDFTGMVVVALDEDGEPWTGGGLYPDGAIPLSELEMEPTTASAEEAYHYWSADGIRSVAVYTGDEANEPIGYWGRYNWSDFSMGVVSEGQYTGCTMHFGTVLYDPFSTVLLTRYNGRPYAYILESEADMLTTITVYPEYPLYASSGKIRSGRWNEGGIAGEHDEDAVNVPESTINPMEATGELVAGQLITVSWMRQTDFETLTASFLISVTALPEGGGGGAD